MHFVEDLKTYLLRLRQTPAMPSQQKYIVLDPSWVRAAIVQAFERLEKEAQEPGTLRQLPLEFDVWMSDDSGVVFSDKVAEELQNSFLRGQSREAIGQHVQFAIEMQLGLSRPIPSLIRRLELERICEKAANTTWTVSRSRSKWTSPPDYALEIRAARRLKDGLILAPIGNVLVSLSGRDAIQWLLSVEVAQSTGPMDDWRLSRTTIDDLLSNPRVDVSVDAAFPHSWATMRRLSAMGVLVLTSESGWDGYELTEFGTSALRHIATPTGTPFSVLATTLSQDEALAALSGSMEKPLPEASLHGSAEAAARQARLVAHEIRNALLPAQVALTSLYESLVGGGVEAEVARFRPRIDPGISRVFKFVNDLLKTSELATRPPEPFNLVSAVQDAQVSLSSTLDIRWMSSVELPPVLGYRDRFVLAMVNLLRNAEQAGAHHVLFELKLEEDGQGILITVDDDGSGVPAEHRERIFQRGVSLRPGGLGEGLALVKDVIESELRGKIACVEKPGGGARFRMRVPLAERSAR